MVDFSPGFSPAKAQFSLSALGLIQTLVENLLPKPAVSSLATNNQTDYASVVVAEVAKNNFAVTAGTNNTTTAGTAKRLPNIRVVDDFTSVQQPNNFQHGTRIVETILGIIPGANVARTDVSGNNSVTNAANAVEKILADVKAGQKVDAVNVSLYVGTDSADARRFRVAADALADLGVPVLVAAGNDGPNGVNQFATAKTIEVESFSAQGQRNATSGIGSAHDTATTTSFATANLTGKVAQLIAAGVPLAQVKSIMASNGNTLTQAIVTANLPTVTPTPTPAPVIQTSPSAPSNAINSLSGLGILGGLGNEDGQLVLIEMYMKMLQILFGFMAQVQQKTFGNSPGSSPFAFVA